MNKKSYRFRLGIWLLLGGLATSSLWASRWILGGAGAADGQWKAHRLIESAAIDSKEVKNWEDENDANLGVGFTDTLLVDSILTIVQSYYVDASRVGSRKLMQTTLESLQETEFFTLSKDKDSGKDWQISSGNEVMRFHLHAGYNYEDLLRDAERLTVFLKEHPPLAAASPRKSAAQRLLVAMLAGLDPHSNLLSQEEYKDLRQGTEGSFGGLGVVVGMQDDILTVVKPLPKSPASRAGVVKADRITKIDGRNTFGTTLDDLVQYMRGEPGTEVQLSILNSGDFAPRQLSLVREVIKVDSVESRLIGAEQHPILFAAIDSFSARTAAELREALLLAKRSTAAVQGVILDLRSNPGGLLDQAVKVADLFLDEGRILSTEGRSREVELAKPGSHHFDWPLIVLINGDSASASEIVAGALRDQGRAVVIGEPSFGKGSVQTVFELPLEQALKLTISRYYTPRGTSIQNTGIMPDIWLQPLFQAAQNVNLLGEYRYKSERSLQHTLDLSAGRQDTSRQLWKAYYLAGSASIQKSDLDDVPLAFAQSLISQLQSPPEGVWHRDSLQSIRILQSVRPFLKERLQYLGSQVREWLDQSLKIDWQDIAEDGEAQAKELVERKRVQDSVRLEVPKSLEVPQGDVVVVPWTLENFGDKPLKRVSLFVSAQRSELGTTEVLLGQLAAGEVRKGEIRYEAKVAVEDGVTQLRVGMVLSAEALPVLEERTALVVRPSHQPEMAITMRIVDDMEGQLPGVLEPGEHGNLEIVVSNTSQTAAHDVEAQLSNLAGRQIELETPLWRIGSLEADQKRILLVPVHASSELVSTELSFGISIASRPAARSSKQQFSLKARAAPRVSQSQIMTGRGPWKEN